MDDIRTARTASTPCVAFGLDKDHHVKILVRLGDLLRGEAGLVWATVAGRFGDILLAPGRSLRFADGTQAFLSGFGPARATLTRHAAPSNWTATLYGLARATFGWAGRALARPAAVRP